jgi:hypothetical protein
MDSLLPRGTHFAPVDSRLLKSAKPAGGLWQRQGRRLHQALSIRSWMGRRTGPFWTRRLTHRNGIVLRHHHRARRCFGHSGTDPVAAPGSPDNYSWRDPPAGVFLMVAGVVVCSWAGRQREREQRSESTHVGERFYMIGVFMAAAAGLLAPMLNYSLAFGDVFILQALPHHATRPDAPYAVWPIALAGGAVPNLVYAGWLKYRNKTWRNFVPVWPQS